MAIYRIAKWESVFERAESRKLKQLTWVAMPVGFTSHGYQSLLDEFGEDAPAIYGAWCALVGVAAGCVHRGIFCSGRGIPLTIPRISRMTGFEAALIGRLFDWASREDIRWLEVVEPEELEQIIGEPIAENPVKHEEKAISGESPDDPPTPQGNPPTTRHNKTRHYRTLPNKTEDQRAEPPIGSVCGDKELREWLVWWNSLRRNEPPMVPCGANENEPSQAILKAWKRVSRDAELRKLVTDRDAIEREIRASSFVKGAGWFRPEKVLAGKNQDGEWMVKKLLEGGYRDGTKTSRGNDDSRNDRAARGRGSLFSGT